MYERSSIASALLSLPLPASSNPNGRSPTSRDHASRALSSSTGSRRNGGSIASSFELAIPRSKNKRVDRVRFSGDRHHGSGDAAQGKLRSLFNDLFQRFATFLLVCLASYCVSVLNVFWGRVVRGRFIRGRRAVSLQAQQPQVRGVHVAAACAQKAEGSGQAVLLRVRQVPSQL